jgi:hypothetical protein
MNDRGSIPGRSSGKNFIVTTASRQDLGPTQPSVEWVLGAVSPSINRPGREAGHLPPSSADVKNGWSYTSTLPCVSTT